MQAAGLIFHFYVKSMANRKQLNLSLLLPLHIAPLVRSTAEDEERGLNRSSNSI